MAKRMPVSGKDLRFELLDHTADLSVKIFGRSHKEIFSNAVYAFNKITVDEFSGISGETELSITSGTIENLFVDFLSRLIFELDANSIIYVGIKEFSLNNNSMKTIMSFSKIGDSHEYSNVIKGITYHDLVYDVIDGFAIVVFDI